MHDELSVELIKETRQRLDKYVVTTPTVPWVGSAPWGEDVSVHMKLELFQRTGTFKVRGAMNAMLALDETERRRGITAVSAGNHAIAVAYCAASLGISARIFMPAAARPMRIERARSYGADVELCETQTEMFERAEGAQTEEGRTFVHPFDGKRTVQGTATVGLELTSQVSPLDLVVVPVGGGGLCAGIASLLKQVWPRVQIVGVEPEGANTMSRSVAAGKPLSNENVHTIADSLAPPRVEPYTFALCREQVDEWLTVSDHELVDAMSLLFNEMKLAVEPAGAATTAAMMGPLKDRVGGQRVGIICCGANISINDYFRFLNNTQD